MHARNNFDLLRLVAALLVGISHGMAAYGFKEPIVMIYYANVLGVNLGAMGVAIFFVISGYLVMKSLIETRSVVLFAIKRILRLYPALILNFIITLFVIIPITVKFSMPDYYSYLSHSSEHILRAFFKLTSPDMAGEYGNSSHPRMNASLWTLHYEGLSYILLGLIGFLRKPRLFVPLAVAVLYWFYQRRILYPMNYIDLGYMYMFIFGLGACVYLYEKYIPWRWWLAALAVLTLIFIWHDKRYSVPIYSFAIVYITIYLAMHVRFTFQAAKYGDFSYGLYIYLWPVQRTLSALFRRDIDYFYLYCALSFAIALGFAFLSWHMVEKPALALKNRFKGKRPVIRWVPSE